MKKETFKYQIVAVLSPKIEDKEKELTLSKIEKNLAEIKAEVVKKDHWGTKDLAYAIKKSNKGDFWILDVESEVPVKLKDINLFLNREVSVIRYLVLKQ
jgi:small subunit ribosomal protein S6